MKLSMSARASVTHRSMGAVIQAANGSFAVRNQARLGNLKPTDAVASWRPFRGFAGSCSVVGCNGERGPGGGALVDLLALVVLSLVGLGGP